MVKVEVETVEGSAAVQTVDGEGGDRGGGAADGTPPSISIQYLQTLIPKTKMFLLRPLLLQHEAKLVSLQITIPGMDSSLPPLSNLFFFASDALSSRPSGESSVRRTHRSG